MSEMDNTFDDFPAETFTIVAFCDDCEHRAPLDREKVPAGVTIQEFPGRLRCSRCGSREASGGFSRPQA
jgi:hypothetical protein